MSRISRRSSVGVVPYALRTTSCTWRTLSPTAAATSATLTGSAWCSSSHARIRSAWPGASDRGAASSAEWECGVPSRIASTSIDSSARTAAGGAEGFAASISPT